MIPDWDLVSSVLVPSFARPVKFLHGRALLPTPLGEQTTLDLMERAAELARDLCDTPHGSETEAALVTRAIQLEEAISIFSAPFVITPAMAQAAGGR